MNQSFITETGVSLELSQVHYLGDSVYAGIESKTGMMVLCCYNGMVAKNVIWIERVVAAALMEYLKRTIGVLS